MANNADQRIYHLKLNAFLGPQFEKDPMSSVLWIKQYADLARVVSR